MVVLALRMLCKSNPDNNKYGANVAQTHACAWVIMKWLTHVVTIPGTKTVRWTINKLMVSL